LQFFPYHDVQHHLPGGLSMSAVMEFLEQLKVESGELRVRVLP